MAALIACRRDSDFSNRKFIRETEETAVRTGISAKAFLPQKINGEEAADKQKWDRHRDRRKRGPKFCGHQVIGESRDEWSRLWGPKHSINYRPHKHIQRGDEGDIHEEPRSKRLRMKIHFLEQPPAEILQS